MHSTSVIQEWNYFSMIRGLISFSISIFISSIEVGRHSIAFDPEIKPALTFKTVSIASNLIINPF